MPLPVSEGFQYFELCARTRTQGAQVLWLLSNIGLYMLATASPFFFGDPKAPMSQPRPFLAYQSLVLGGDGSRLLFVPRWNVVVPQGPPVEVVEPLPVTTADWSVLAPLDGPGRAEWARSLGESARDRWSTVLSPI